MNTGDEQNRGGGGYLSEKVSETQNGANARLDRKIFQADIHGLVSDGINIGIVIPTGVEGPAVRQWAKPVFPLSHPPRVWNLL
jgi:hypothetical protein